MREADEIAAQRALPTSHPLKSVPFTEVRTDPTNHNQTTLILSWDASHTAGVVFRRSARELLNMTSYPTAKFWFYSPQAMRADRAVGVVQSWAEDGEITFTGGTRLNDKLLVRVTF